MMSISAGLAKSAFMIGVSRIFVNMLGFASTIFLARMLLPSDFGVVAVAHSIFLLVTIVTELSLSQAIIQRDDPDQEFYHTAFTLGLIRAVALAALIGALASPVAQFYGDARLEGLLLALAASTVVSGLINPRMATFQRGLDFRKEVMLAVTDKIVSFLVAICVAVVWRSYWALILGIIAGQVAQVLLSHLLIDYKPKLTFSRFNAIFGFSIWLTFGRFVQALNWRSDPLLLGYFISSAQLGLYSLGLRLSTMIVGEALTPISQILFPALSRMKSNPERLRSAYLKAQGLLCFIAIPIGVGFALLAEPIILFLIGEKWSDAIPLVQVLAWTAVVPRLHSVEPLAMATGHTKALFFRDVRALVIRLPLFLGGMFLGPSLGVGMLMGAVLGRSAAALINAALNITLVPRISSITLRDQLLLIVRPILGTCAMSIALICVPRNIFLYSGFVNDFLNLVVLISVGAISYFLVCFSLWLLMGKPEGSERNILSFSSNVYDKIRASTRIRY